ncbi:MAG: type IX secretion system plug protein domain-containing protein [Rhodothermales bacterium]
MRWAEPPRTNLHLRAPLDAVKTIQLYAEEEDQLPVLPLDSGRTLTLEFDLMEGAGRPLSVYFYHATRQWERDLIPSEYLTSFHRDDLFDYTISYSTQVPYTHYTYSFPNGSIDFRLSGNYILRVTEQGQEEEVLFERPFFVTEDVTTPQLGIDNVIVGGHGYPSDQPILTFTPPQALAGNVFDYNACFVRNGQLENTRCTDRPSLTQQPNLLFFLQPERSFEPQEGDYFLDIGHLRVGGDIERTDFSASPYFILLEPDYAQFPSTGLDPLLNGQLVVSDAVREVGDPDTQSEYVHVGFSYVPPDEERLMGGLLITGSFNGWAFDLANELDWVAERGRYEGELLLKQGQYEYRYTSPEPDVRRRLRANLPRPDNFYAAFVYYYDISQRTDRLLAYQHLHTR